MGRDGCRVLARSHMSSQFALFVCFNDRVYCILLFALVKWHPQTRTV